MLGNLQTNDIHDEVSLIVDLKSANNRALFSRITSETKEKRSFPHNEF